MSNVIVVNEQFVFLSNPRTGCRAFTKGLIAAGAVPLNTQHYHPSPKELKDYIHYPKYTVLREPIDWVLSHYLAFGGDTSFEEWISKPLKVLDWAVNRLNAYDNIATHYMLYEWGHEAMFVKLGITPPSIPLIGSTSKKRKDFQLTTEQKEKIIEKFPIDVMQYEYYKRALPTPAYVEPDRNREQLDSLILEAST